jgi:hypothetical protein
LRRTYSYEINADKRIFYFSAFFLKIRETERNEIEKRREDGRERERERERASMGSSSAKDSAMQNCNSLQTATLVDKCVIAGGKMNHVVCLNHGRMDGVDGGGRGGGGV